jgi:outer membrane protein OmpA-like peptidoglycan-associated protein
MSLALLLASTLAFFGPGAEGSASASGSASGGSGAMHRHAPQNHMLELGVWGGILLPSAHHEFYDPVGATHLPFRLVAPDFGLRFAYFPLRFLGGEIEGGVMPTRDDAGSQALLYTVRGHVIARLPWWRLAPFLVVGGGNMGVSSGAASVGKDIDMSFHWGPGLEFFINDWLAVRLDGRHLVGAREGYKQGVAHHFEVLAGLSVTFRLGKGEQSSEPGDPDQDGFYGYDDKCPDEPGTYPNGCPAEDSDGDGVADDDDQCPDEPGTIPDGCPAPDRDGDGVADTADECPDEPGAKPDGCSPDTDGDGVLNDADACPQEPESDNGYEDEDGCPDEIPTKLRGAAGRMPGITFEVNSAKITPESKETLDTTVEVLEQNPKYVVHIEGHTDSAGDRQHNLDLSQRRADAVAKYLINHGIDEDRVSTKGYGPDKPIASNDTPEGRAENRRIEFKLRKKGRRK